MFRKRPEQIDHTVEVPLATCPHCHLPVEDMQAVRQWIEDIVPMRAHVTELVTYRGHCRACGPVTSSHPMKQSEAVGAAAVQLGLKVLALSAKLIYDFAMTRRKVCRQLRERFGGARGGRRAGGVSGKG